MKTHVGKSGVAADGGIWKSHTEKYEARRRLRRALYMPAMVAYSRCAAFAPFVQRLKAAGKPPKVIIVALMRKLVTIAQAILKSGKPFDPTLHHA